MRGVPEGDDTGEPGSLTGQQGEEGRWKASMDTGRLPRRMWRLLGEEGPGLRWGLRSGLEVVELGPGLRP